MKNSAEPNQIPASVGAHIMDGVGTLRPIKNMELTAQDAQCSCLRMNIDVSPFLVENI